MQRLSPLLQFCRGLSLSLSLAGQLTWSPIDPPPSTSVCPSSSSTDIRTDLDVLGSSMLIQPSTDRTRTCPPPHIAEQHHLSKAFARCSGLAQHDQQLPVGGPHHPIDHHGLLHFEELFFV